MPDRVAYLGKHRRELDTPALLLDLDAFESNLAQMAALCASHGTGWRPHCKAHKCPAIARRQLRAGAIGITCAKLSEAEMLVDHGVGPLLIANQVVTPGKLTRLARLQSRQQVIAAVDDAAVLPHLSAAAAAADTCIPVLVELDIGMHRVGVEPGGPALELARQAAATPGVQVCGLMGYEGHVLNMEPAAAKERACHAALQHLVDTRLLLEQAGIAVDIVSAGGTGCYAITAAHPGVTEVQAGGGIFMDAKYRHEFHVEGLDYALSVLTTVTSRSADHIVVDAGFKTMSAFHGAPQPRHRDDLRLRNLSAEHGIFELCDGATAPQVGEQIEFIPGYSDSTTVLHDRFLGLRGDRVERVWPIRGRGLLT